MTIIMPCQLILYACPLGPLANQIEGYLEESRKQWGDNKAHQYMPHCTLTGFFHDRREAIALYLQTLETVMASATKTPATVQVTDLLFQDDWHGLTLESSWLQALAQSFAKEAVSPTRTETLRLKTGLHVSLAYGFDPAHAQGLKQLAIEQVDPRAPVEWEIRFYERSPKACMVPEMETRDSLSQRIQSSPNEWTNWTCHGRWQV